MKLAEHSDRGTSLWGLIPVKTISRAKQRLKPCMDNDRSGFTIAMFLDVVRAMEKSDKIKYIAVVTTDPQVVEICESRGLLVVDEVEAMGLNPALELGVAAIRRRGGKRVVILPADTPLVTGPKIDAALLTLSNQNRFGEKRTIGISPARGRDGTNLLCLDTDQPMPLSYGPDSYNRHLAIAVENGLEPITLESINISIDIDKQDDLEAFVSFCIEHPEHRQTNTWLFLQQNGYVDQSGRRRTG